MFLYIAQLHRPSKNIQYCTVTNKSPPWGNHRIVKKLSPLKNSLNPLLPKNDLQTLLCLTPDDFTRQRGEVSSYENLETVFISLGEYDKAKEYLEKALAIKTRIVDKQGEAAIYSNLGTVFKRLREYDKAKEYLEKKLVIKKGIGDKRGEARLYGNLGTVFISLGECDKAKEYLEKALAIKKEICDKTGEAASYGN